MARIIFGTFHIFFILDVMLQLSVKRHGVTDRTAFVGKLMTWQTTTCSHSKLFSCRAAKRVQILNRVAEQAGEKRAFIINF